MHFDVVITKEGKNYSSWCPQLDIASCGKSIEDAKKNLEEAIELYLEDEDAVINKQDSSVTLTSIEVNKNDKTTRAIRA
ncbi:MAG: type II toxin-antitoxin system HicB family antitoxin [Candidatus Aenigmarchaeota archaeon]|nr:type II toxin-antitoxin system HicB family antitoxin [Candidatus Aenigmarchaeota archaeon]